MLKEMGLMFSCVPFKAPSLLTSCPSMTICSSAWSNDAVLMRPLFSRMLACVSGNFFFSLL
ncbi:hypothetical protein PBAL39_25420 [Pedobacter sp. BAL39]|nr:hypothetical protein PBAL39_25420 [Pedobacter sp. BAL39]